jgi:ABC-type multidrug transport system fused ATPase/permease subunit
LGLIIVGIILSLLHGLVVPSFGIHIARILAYDMSYEADPNYYGEQIKIHCLIMFVTAIVGAFFNKFQYKIFLSIGSDVNKELKSEIYRKILKMPMEWFDKE